MVTIPRELLEAFASGNGTLFIGAGLSMGAGLPSWGELVGPLGAEVEDCPPSASPMQIAQFFENEFGRNRLVQRLRQMLAGYDVQPTAVHETLLSLPVQRIFTSNFDQLIETALVRSHRPYDRVVENEDVGLMNAPTKVVKIHGDLEHAGSIVVTTEDYDNYPATKPAIADLLKAELQSKTVLFLGYSFNDDDLRVILSRVSRESRALRRNLFTVQFAPTRTALKDFDRQGLVVIPLQGSDHPHGATGALLEWIEEFCRSLHDQAGAGSAPAPLRTRNHNLPSLSRSGELVGRTRDLARVLEGLRSRYPLITIEGFAGIGKTSLAARAGYVSSGTLDAPPGRALFDYVVWISAKDKPDQNHWLNDVLNAIATTTNFPVITQLSSKEQEKKIAQVDLLLRSYRILVIIDNFESIEDPELERWMEEIPEPSKVLVTTRNNQVHQKAWAVCLRGLEAAEALVLMRQHAAQTGLTFVHQAGDEALLELSHVTSGNPQAMKLALGLAAGGGIPDLKRVVNQLHGANPTESMDAVFDQLFAESWRLLHEPARQILLVAPLFVGVSSIRRDALQAATGFMFEPFDFDNGLTECKRFGLLEEDHTLAQARTDHVAGTRPERYAIHPLTRAFARRKLNERADFEEGARSRCTEYFLCLVRESVIRPKPDRRYWNATVTDGMLDLDPEWPSIEQVLMWADAGGDQKTFVEFVMLLVHYMDSRFLNRERMAYVRTALDILHLHGRRADEALFRIDALGWTYVEEDRLEDAYEEIMRGFAIAETLATEERQELLALGLAWRARVRIEQGQAEEASRLIRDALGIECPPWIKYRVYMSAGDIALKQRESSKALDFYKLACQQAEEYGGEGHGYQTLPRIGLAHLGVGDLKAAEEEFRHLHSYKQIAIGRLYAEYGLAMVAYQRGQALSARSMIDDVKKKLSRRTTSNLLLKLINRWYDDLESGRGGSAGAQE